ncbi:MAG: hypothetical protein COA33_013550 [Fluviicola sp.]|nr:hypothetical protein [Fluviicola sp.]
MKKHTIIILVLLITLVSCSEPQEKSDFDKILEKIENGSSNESDINKLLESISDQEGSYEVSFPDAKFTIKFPVTNVKESSTIQIIDNEEVEIFHYTANMQGKDHINLAYQLDYVFLPEVKLKEEIDDLFNEQRDYIVSAANSELEFEKIIEKNDAIGRHLYLTIDESEIKTNYKMYFKNGIFYKLAVITEDGKLFNKSIGHFFDSFEITE